MTLDVELYVVEASVYLAVNFIVTVTSFPLMEYDDSWSAEKEDGDDELVALELSSITFPVSGSNRRVKRPGLRARRRWSGSGF